VLLLLLQLMFLGRVGSIMMIEADGYAYWCSDKNVDIGDTVIVTVSAGWDNIFGRVAERTVSSLSSDYSGPCESVVKVIKKS